MTYVFKPTLAADFHKCPSAYPLIRTRHCLAVFAFVTCAYKRIKVMGRESTAGRGIRGLWWYSIVAYFDRLIVFRITPRPAPFVSSLQKSRDRAT